jgi:ABC-type dipeptide/oligopeptide/nickel transport system permease component
MIRFIVRRILSGIPVVFGVIALVFVLARVIPGDPCRAALQEHANAATCDAFNKRFGLTEPIPIQFALYLRDIATGNLGESIKTGQPVTQILVERLPTTVELTIYALLFAVVAGMTLGVISAYRRNSPADVATMMTANLGVSVPVFVLGLLLAFLFAIVFKGTALALPPSGRLPPGYKVVPIAVAWGLGNLTGPGRTVLDFLSNMYSLNAILTLNFNLFAESIRHLILPAIALGTIPMAIIARMTRSSLLEVLGQDYVRTARAKGMMPRTVMLRHGLRNALLPVVTVIGLSVGALLSGAVLTETIFGLAGIGTAVYDSIQGRDYIVIQGMALLVAIVYVAVNLVVDVSYGFLDPRVRLS